MKKTLFSIVTNGTTRIFTDSKYHNLSEVVYSHNLQREVTSLALFFAIPWLSFYLDSP